MCQFPARMFDSAELFQLACVKAASDGSLVLCVTARLARRLLHVSRMEKIHLQVGAWETPHIRSFGGWIHETFESLWDTRVPLSIYSSQHLWHEAVASIKAPAGFDIQPSLYRDFQLAFDALQAMGVDPAGAESGYELPDFRRACTASFLKLIKTHGLISWADMIQAIVDALLHKRLQMPGSIILAGFDNFSPLENRLMSVLHEVAKVERWRTSREPDPGSRIQVYANSEQECRAVSAQVLKAWNEGSKNLGVVFLDQSYFPLLNKYFDELAGERRPTFKEEIRYNLTLGIPLSSHPLFQAAILPFRILAEPVPARFLAALFVSPYVRKSDKDWYFNLRTALWDVEMPLSLADALNALLRLGYPVRHLQRLAVMNKAPLREWLCILQECWKELQFPQFEGEQRTKDALAKQHLAEIIDNLSKIAGNVSVNCADALAWISVVAERTVVAEKTPEIAGIQVLNLAESSGLAFDKLWVVGAHGEVLPQPRQDWFLLTPSERQQMDDYCTEHQWKKARRDIAALCASAQDVSFSRADTRGEEVPYLACPLIPDETDSAGNITKYTLDLWNNPPSEWARARWLRRGYTANLCPEKKVSLKAQPIKQCISGEWTVTDISDLFSCPFRFFGAHLLQLEPLKIASAGINPKMRGEVIHAILRTFVRQLPEKAPDWPDDKEQALTWLRQATESELKKQPDNLFWRVEQLRLLGDKQFPGVLPEWLKAERKRARENWQFAATEIVFKGLELGGLLLSGRVDRVDYHKQKGLIIWDYKSGTLPTSADILSAAFEPQLPIYLIALKRGLLMNIHQDSADVQVGYIPLKSAARVIVKPIRKNNRLIIWAEQLTDWNQSFLKRLKEPQCGIFQAMPASGTHRSFPGRRGVCRYCEFYNLCGYFDQLNANQK